ncbi:MAG: S1 RNA-binding domain-containing protein, partial [Bacteroidota bacterium]
GFLRIRHAKNPLDNTSVHPESYAIVEQMAKSQKIDVATLITEPSIQKRLDLNNFKTEKVGLPTLQDILKELEKPGLDPRGKAMPIQFDKSIQTIDDLEVGKVLNGVINNLTKFGAFVDLGIKSSGLIHISQITNKFIKDPAEVLQLNQEVRVKVLEVDKQRKRISLTLKF